MGTRIACAFIGREDNDVYVINCRCALVLPLRAGKDLYAFDSPVHRAFVQLGGTCVDGLIKA